MTTQHQDLPGERRSSSLSPRLHYTIAKELPHGAVFVVDQHLRYLLAAGEELKAAGFTSADFEGKTVREAIPANEVDQYERDYNTVLEGGSFSLEHEVSLRRYHTYGVPLTNDRGETELALVVSYEVGDRVRAERQVGMFHELGEILQPVTHAEALLDRVASMLRRHLGTDGFFVADVDHRSTNMVELTHLLEQVGLHRRQALSTLGADYFAALRLGFTVVGPSSGHDAHTVTLPRTLDMRSYVLLPRLRSGHLAGVVAVSRPIRRSWHPDDLKIARLIVDRMWDAIARLRVMDGLQRLNLQEHKFLSLPAACSGIGSTRS